MATLMIDGSRFGYDESGHGEPIVLVHGDAADRRMWDHLLPALARNHRVIRYDRRGYGESDDSTRTIAHHRDLLRVMDGLDVRKAAFVGCSMGAAHAVDAALESPERVSALALISPGLSGHTWPDSMLAQAAEFVGDAVPEERRAVYRTGSADVVREDDVHAAAVAQARFLIAGPSRDPAQVDADVWQRSVEMLELIYRREWSRPAVDQEMAEPPAKGRLGEIQVPTVVVNGCDDVPGIQALAPVLVDGIAGAVRVDLPDTAHASAMERPAEVADTVTAMLERADWQ